MLPLLPSLQDTEATTSGVNSYVLNVPEQTSFDSLVYFDISILENDLIIIAINRYNIRKGDKNETMVDYINFNLI